MLQFKPYLFSKTNLTMSIYSSLTGSPLLLAVLTATIFFLFVNNRNVRLLNISLAESLSKMEETIQSEESAREVCLSQLEARTKEVVDRDEQITALTNQVDNYFYAFYRVILFRQQFWKRKEKSF